MAGSEKLNKHEEIKIGHFKELKNINQSLTTLGSIYINKILNIKKSGKVIHNLSLTAKFPIPYRESKLTRLLQDSIGGNTQTCLLATIAPSVYEYNFTKVTIK